MFDLSLPRTLIVVQIIFGSPLRRRREFRGREIEDLVREDLGQANYAKVLDRLVEVGWVERVVRQEAAPLSGGRPSIYLYRRTRYGRQEYTKLKSRLARYGIILS